VAITCMTGLGVVDSLGKQLLLANSGRTLEKISKLQYSCFVIKYNCFANSGH